MTESPSPPHRAPVHGFALELSAARRELDLALALLRSSAVQSAPKALATPVAVLPPSAIAETVECNLEIMRQDKNLALVSGWAFVREGHCANPTSPVLLLGCGEAWFALTGTTRERPDVLAVFPPPAGAEQQRLHSGILFEFDPTPLPGAITACKVLLSAGGNFRGVSRSVPFVQRNA